MEKVKLLFMIVAFPAWVAAEALDYISEQTVSTFVQPREMNQPLQPQLQRRDGTTNMLR